MCWKPTQRCWRLPLGGGADPPPAARATVPSHLPPWAMVHRKPRWLTHVGMKLRSLWSRWNRLYSTEYTQSPLPMRPGTDCTETTPPSALSPLRPDHPCSFSPLSGSSPLINHLQNPHLRWRKTQLVQGGSKVLSYKKNVVLHLPVSRSTPRKWSPNLYPVGVMGFILGTWQNSCCFYRP